MEVSVITESKYNWPNLEKNLISSYIVFYVKECEIPHEYILKGQTVTKEYYLEFRNAEHRKYPY